MKILQIEIENIHSLRGRHVLDFRKEPLSNAGLFLITGPTGAGKSSILDAITLALYNRIPRFSVISKNEIQKMGSVVTHFEKRALASVLFEVDSGVFKSTWLIEQTRNHTWRDYHMEVFDVDNDQLMDLKRSDVPDKNEELIGLSYEQFLKSILLSQGEFARFLSANTHDRGRLLEKITGSQIYRSLGKMAYQKYKHESAQLAEIQRSLSAISVWMPEEEKRQRDLLTEKEDELKVLEKEKSRIQIAAGIKEELREYTRQFLQIQAALKQSEKEYNELIDDWNRLSDHLRIQPFASKMSVYEKLCADLEEKRRVLEQRQKEHAELKGRLDQCLKRFEQLSGIATNRSSFISDLSSWVEAYNGLTTESKVILKEAGDHRTRADKIIVQLNDKNLPEKVDSEEGLRYVDQILTSRDVEKQFKKSGPSIDVGEIDKLLQEEDRLKLVLQINLELSALQMKAKQSDVVLAQLKNDHKKQGRELHSQRDKLKQLEVKEAETGKLLTQHQQSMDLATWRSQLVAGEPCPLCGSTHHPYQAHEAVYEEGKLQVSLRILKEDIAELRKIIEGLTSQLIQVETRIENLEAQKREEQLKVEALSSRLSGDLNWHVSWPVEKIEEEVLKVTQTRANLVQSIEAENLLEKLERVKEAFEELIRAKNAYEVVVNRRKSLYAGDDFDAESRDLMKQFQDASTNLERTESLWLQLEKEVGLLEKSVDDSRQELTNLLASKGVGSMDSALRMRLPELEYVRLSEAKQVFEAHHQDARSRLDQLQTMMHKTAALDDDDRTLEQLLHLRSKVETSISEILITIGKLQQAIKSNEEQKQKRNAIESEVGEKIKNLEYFEHLNQLIGDAEGNKFSNYAQDLTLKVLIQSANLHLSSLSDRYVLVPTSISEELRVFDTYQGDVERAAATLSGGETFLLSLSLALGLSDLAAKNVRIESIFIDEGFGSLDAESLEMAILTLEKLQDRGEKKIGIISHVESLKERIAHQINVSRDARGYSSILLKG